MDVEVVVLDISSFLDSMGEGKVMKLLKLKVEEVAVVYPFFYTKRKEEVVELFYLKIVEVIDLLKMVEVEVVLLYIQLFLGGEGDSESPLLKDGGGEGSPV